MDTIVENLFFIIVPAALVTVFTVLACRTKYTLIFTVLKGISAMLAFLAMIFLSASLEEILLVLALVSLPSFLIKRSDGGKDK